MEVLTPIVHETIWGGDKLTPFSNSTSRRIGHLYSFIDNSTFVSRIESGKFAGRSLHEWFDENKQRYGLSQYSELPILGAMVEAKQTLSIQVHPDDANARQLADLPFGKNESFYTLHPPTSGKMFNGCKAESIEELRLATQDGRVADFLDTMECEAGDYVYIEGGTLHAAAEGSLHFEVEENCDKTYRLYDFDRLDSDGKVRPLQVDNALACIDIKKKSVSRKYDDDPIVERMYSTQLVKGRRSYKNEGDMFKFAVLIQGEKMLSGIKTMPGKALILEPGEELDVTDAVFMLIEPKVPGKERER